MFLSKKNSHREFSLHSAHVALAIWLLLPAAGLWAQGQEPSVSRSASSSLPASDPKETRLKHVVHVVGLRDVKAGASGDLTFDKSMMLFSAGADSVAIPRMSILAFSISHDNVALISGTKGKLAGMAPYGVGQAITAIRPSADTLTLLYRDSSSAIHGCILILPKGAGDAVVTALADAKILPTEYPKSGQFGLTEGALRTTPASNAEIKRSKPSVEVDLLTESADGVPSAFPIAEYEELISQLTDSGLFEKVWRQGDTRRNSGTLVLQVNINELKTGSARSRGLVPFTGATVIKTNVTLVDSSGRTVFQQNIKGSKRMRGESLDATASLAKEIRKELLKAPGLRSHN